MYLLRIKIREKTKKKQIEGEERKREEEKKKQATKLKKKDQEHERECNELEKIKAKSAETNRLQKDAQELKPLHRATNNVANQKIKEETDEPSLMHEWVEEMSLEVKQSKRHIKSEQKQTKLVSVTLNRTLEVWRNLRAEVAELKD